MDFLLLPKIQKKGLFFSPGLVLVALFILIQVFIVLDGKEKNVNSILLGQRQHDVFNTYIEGEFEILQIDNYADLSLKQSILDLAASGAHQQSDCGAYNGYNIWGSVGENTEVTRCYPSKKEEILKSKFQMNFANFLKMRPDQNLELEDYETSLQNNLDLKGETNKMIPIIDNEKGNGENQGIISYSVYPDFVVHTDYSFSDYNTLIAKTDELIKLCKSKGETCLEENKEIYNAVDENGVQTLEVINTCESETYEQFLQFVDYVDQCIHSITRVNCACRNKPDIEGTFSINMVGGNPMVEGIINGIKYSQEITSKLPIESVNELTDITDSLLLHKDGNGNLLKEEDIEIGKTCKLRPKEKFRICVQSNKKVLTKGNGQEAGLHNIQYKFALEFKQPLNVEVEKILSNYRVVLDTSCNVLPIAEKLAESLQDSVGQIIVATSASKCDKRLIAEDIAENAFDSQLETVFLLVIDDPESSSISYSNADSLSEGQREANKLLAETIQEKLQDTASLIISPLPEDIFSERTSVRLSLSQEILEKEETSKIADALGSSLKRFVEAKEQYLSLQNQHGFGTQTIIIPLDYQEGELHGTRGILKDLSIINKIAEDSSINQFLLAALIQTESSYVNINEPEDGKAHGLGQQFRPAIQDILNDLLKKPTYLSEYPDIMKLTAFAPNTKTKAQHIYERILTSAEPENVLVHVRATALYLKKVESYLEAQGKPTDSRTIIQAYHDGVGKIRQDGSSERILNGEQESIEYYPKVEQFYMQFMNQYESRVTS